MIRMNFRSMACNTLNRILPIAPFSEEQLAQIQNVLAAAEDTEMLTNTFIAERAKGLWAFNNADGFIGMVLASNRERERYLTYMNQLVDASRLPPWEAMTAMENIGTKISSSRWWFIPTLTDIMIPNLLSCETTYARENAYLLSAEAAIAAERYRLANGRPPANVGDLVPAFLTAVPLDPFDGQPLRYTTDDHGYTFYSVGLNRRDDHGSTPHASEVGDIVFRVERM
jgi:hypothetical protein